MAERVPKGMLNDLVQGGALVGYTFWCPGCQLGHLFDSRWTFNGDRERPTFTPSLLVHGVSREGVEYPELCQPRCHLFLTDGQIRFLSDCEHKLAGKTVPMQPFPGDEREP